ncbi:hypothetical protein PV341_28980 [Streptomyces sp. PA03-1a]|nr:hypothetical protein [Streptomyces sp. PA03-1a]MDX2818405.1 hypothetical protein [Streptomyces sp. PA03-5A]
MPKTLVGTSDPDQPPPGPVLYAEHVERMVLAAVLHHPQLTPYFMADLRRHAAALSEGLPPVPMRGFLTDDDT